MQCPSCRREPPRDARFCPFCGTPVRSGPFPVKPTGRKVVTVLFCDLVGSTALSESLDAETMRSVTLRWFELMRLRIEEQGGTVEKFIGDAVMAVFGVPTVREDDARRAVAAALAMREALTGLNDRLAVAVGVRLEMRIGINTGQVVTGSATARQALVSGEVVNIAARLEQNAAAGAILLGPDTLRGAGRGVRTAETGPVSLKGVSDQVTPHLLLGMDEEEGPEALRRFDLGFVGRGHELAELDRALTEVVRTRRARRLVISGEAGQGKTRLLREWIERGTASAAVRHHGVGRCRPRGGQPSLGPLADALAAVLQACGGVGPSPELRLLNEGLLLDGTPNPSVADTCAALCRILTELSATGSVVLVIDDWHWAAPPLLDALDRVLRGLAGAAVLLVVLTRPQLLDAGPEPGQDTVQLGGLSDQEAQLLAAELTGGTSGSGPLPARVLERVGGNPLHLEQLLMSGDAVGEAGVPLPLQALIGARIDALDPPEHRVLGLASVLGGDFTADDLTELAGPPAREWPRAELRTTLHRLARHRLITPEGRAFRFAGGLIQEVVYACQSKQDRAELHERAARLDAVHEEGGAAVGAHLEAAHRYRVELGAQDAHTDRLRRRAADALAEAGRAALAHADPAWAADLLSRASARYKAGEPGSTATRRRLGQALLDLGHGTRGRALLEAVPAEVPPGGEEAVEAAHARLALASAGGRTVPSESPAEAARATLPVFEAAHDDLGQARACLRLAQRHQEQGRYRAAERLLARALAHAERDGAEPERAAALGATGVSLWRGPAPVVDAVARCRDLLAGRGAGRGAVRLTLNCPLAVLLALHDDEGGASACLAEAERLAERLGYAEAEAFLPIFTATVSDLAGRREEALLDLGRAAAVARDLEAAALLRSALLSAARIRLDLGDRRGARTTLAELGGGRDGAAGRVPEPQEGGADGEHRRPSSDAADLDGLRARIAADRGDAATATRAAARALTTAESTDSPIVRGVAHLDHARTALVLGRDVEAAEAAERARRCFLAKGHLPAVRRADAVIDQCRTGASRPGPRPRQDPRHGVVTAGEAGAAGREAAR